MNSNEIHENLRKARKRLGVARGCLEEVRQVLTSYASSGRLPTEVLQLIDPVTDAIVNTAQPWGEDWPQSVEDDVPISEPAHLETDVKEQELYSEAQAIGRRLEREELVAWMRETFPMNKHAREWATTIERVILRGGVLPENKNR